MKSLMLRLLLTTCFDFLTPGLMVAKFKILSPKLTLLVREVDRTCFGAAWNFRAWGHLDFITEGVGNNEDLASCFFHP